MSRRITIIGAGNVGSALGYNWVHKGQSVVFGVPDPSKAKYQELEQTLSGSVSFQRPGQAVEAADVVAKTMVDQAINTFGKLDVVVNNAGILRDRMLVNMTEEEWDSVIQVHLKGTFAPCHFAGKYWREQSKAGEAVDARIINTTSGSGLFGNVGQANYGAAKAGIASFTIIPAMELERYSVTVNAISPGLMLTETIKAELSPQNMAMARGMQFIDADGGEEDVVQAMLYLTSSRARFVTGETLRVTGGMAAGV